MRWLTALALVVPLVLAGSLARGPASALTVRDMIGREVSLPAPPTRLVSLVPSITETLYALGAEDLLIGVTTFCDFPPAARQKPKVGGIVNPSLEVILGLKPDLVLATTEGNRDTTVHQLTGLGLPTYVVSPKTFPGVLESITRIAGLIGREPAGAQLVSALRHRALRVEAATRGRPRPRLLYLLWADPLVVPGRDTLLTELIRMAGGQSVSGDESLEWPRLSLEQVVARQPDVIVVASINAAHVDDALRRWREQGILLPALRGDRVRTVDADVLHRPGPRIVEGLEALAHALHPDFER